MAIGAKTIETRSWRSSYRGPLAIHAAKGVAPIGGKQGFIAYCTEVEQFHRVLSEHMRSLKIQTLDSYLAEIPFGGIVCVVDLVQCLSTNGSFMQMSTLDFEMKNGEVLKNDSSNVVYEKPAPHTDEFAFGNYEPNRWMWFTENLRRLREPVACRGSQGLRDLPADIEALVRAQL